MLELVAYCTSHSCALCQGWPVVFKAAPALQTCAKLPLPPDLP